VPAIFSMILGLIIEVINSAFVGHIGKEEVMAGVGMANMFMNVACLSLLFGMNMVLNTLASQAKGFGNLRMCGIYLNQSRIIMAFIYIPMSVVLLNTSSIFEVVGFDKEASYYS
jgi:Na+-driven multidrug efflux pump